MSAWEYCSSLRSSWVKASILQKKKGRRKEGRREGKEQRKKGEKQGIKEGRREGKSEGGKERERQAKIVKQGNKLIKSYSVVIP